MDLLPKSASGPVEMILSPLAETAEQRLTRQNKRRLDLQQRGRSAVEFGQRYQAFQQQTNLMVRNFDNSQFNATVSACAKDGSIATDGLVKLGPVGRFLNRLILCPVEDAVGN